MRILSYTRWLCLGGLTLLLQSYDNGLSRGIGRYPGSPAECFAPSLVGDNEYRNLALNRPATASSSYDFNLTPQLLTDGIKTTEAPRWLSVATPDGPVAPNQREWTLDGNFYSTNVAKGADTFLSYDWHGQMLRADRVHLILNVAYDETAAQQGGYEVRLLSRNAPDGTASKQWRTVGLVQGAGLPGQQLKYKVHSDPDKVTEKGTLPVRAVELDMALKDLAQFDNLKLELHMPGAAYWTVRELQLFSGATAVTRVLPSFDFKSAWRSNGGGRQWVQVDLGRKATIDKVCLSWVEKAKAGRLEVSTDGTQWTTISKLPKSRQLTDDIAFQPVQGRYVRLMLEKPGKSGAYVLSEMEVYGRGGLVARPHAVGGFQGSHYLLDGGNWLLQRASEVKATGEEISTQGFQPHNWIAATVPGTVLTSYVNIGALPDPNLADNLFAASESFFNANFWYRTEFTVPYPTDGHHIFLNLDGINWKANVYLNGRRLDRIEGAFMRGQTDVTAYLVDGTNVLAVEVECNAHPGAAKEKTEERTGFNGGMLGADNPTFHATIGWDWISSVRGRDMGIWNDVYLSTSGAVSLRDPLLKTQLALPDTLASITPTVVVSNHESHEVSGTLRGHVGEIAFEKPLTLAAGQELEVSFSPDDFAQLRRQRLNLWWPNGYGAPYLYDAGFSFVAEGKTSDAISYKAGIRQMDYKDIDTQLTLYVNGRRFIPLGGNWGFSEVNLNYRQREYDIAVGNHRDMNFNMIRNWVGQIGDEEFYDACDKYGIMVWQDFWLANPADGPDPADEAMFLKNSADFTARMRRHPSIALYCGRNEGYPPATIDKALRQQVAALNPGLAYISSSADDGVSGHGPYNALPAKEYFARQTGKLHSERGMPNVMTFEGISRTLAPDALWPQTAAYGRHDFTMSGAQRGASFNHILEKAFGSIGSAEQFASLAQWENYEGYRAMYESGSHDRMGLVIWMSHACWPTFVWQCYDYYFEPTAAYFGCKKACEPLHIQWNALTRQTEVVNLCAGEHTGLKAVLQVLDFHGRLIWQKEARLSSQTDSTAVLADLSVEPGFKPTEGNVYFLKQSLYGEKDALLSSNFYVLSADEGNLHDLNTLPEVELQATVRRVGDSFHLTLTNPSQEPAMMVRLNLKASDGEQILPVRYTDNFFHLMPGEEKRITVSWNQADARRLAPQIEITGFNLKPQTLQ